MEGFYINICSITKIYKLKNKPINNKIIITINYLSIVK